MGAKQYRLESVEPSADPDKTVAIFVAQDGTKIVYVGSGTVWCTWPYGVRCESSVERWIVDEVEGFRMRKRDRP